MYIKSLRFNALGWHSVSKSSNLLIVGWDAISFIPESELEQRIKRLVHIQKPYYRTVAAELVNVEREYYIKKKSEFPFGSILFPIG